MKNARGQRRSIVASTASHHSDEVVPCNAGRDVAGLLGAASKAGCKLRDRGIPALPDRVIKAAVDKACAGEDDITLSFADMLMCARRNLPHW